MSTIIMSIINAFTLRYLRLSLMFKRNSTNFWLFHQNIHKYSDSPVKYTGSNAAGWKAEFTRRGASQEDNSPWFQPYVVSISLAIFLVYFCILREENDLDAALDVSLFDRIEGLEKTQLNTILKFNQERGIESKEIKARLQQLEVGNHSQE